MNGLARLIASGILVLFVASCQASTPVMATPNRAAAATATPMVDTAAAERIVGRLDELALLSMSGPGTGTDAWTGDEARWSTAHMADLLDHGGALATYVDELQALSDAVAEGADQTAAIDTLLALRDDIAGEFALPTLAPAPSGPLGTASLIGDGSLHDAVGDLANSDGTPVDAPAYLDIRDLEVVADGTTLRLTLTLAGDLPPPPLAIERLNYHIDLSVYGDADPGTDVSEGGHHYAVTLSKPITSGGFQPTLWDLPSDPTTNATSYQGQRFPGTAVVAGNTIVWTVGLAAIGNPHLIRLGASTASTVDTGSGVMVGTSDRLPEDGFDDWLTLGS